jgi:hypothetical protein
MPAGSGCNGALAQARALPTGFIVLFPFESL